MERKNRIPITRLSRYYDENDFQLELDMAREVIEEDTNFTVVLYRIDKVNSNNEDVYGESESREIRFHSPVELKVLLLLNQAENKSYGENGSLRYQDYGNLVFTVLTNQLEEKNVDISFGDIIAFSDKETNLKYFEVYDDGKINSDNTHTQYGYKAYFRTISCVTVDPDQFNGI